MAEDVQAGQGTGNGDEKTSLEKMSISMDKRADLAMSVFTVLLGVFVLIVARGIRAGSTPDPITSRGLPTIMGVLLIVGGVILAIRQLLHWEELPGHLVPEEGQEDEAGYPSSAVRALGIILLSIVWAWFLEPVGFLFITPLYLVVCEWVMGEKSWMKNVVYSVIYTIASWTIFGLLMGMRLPLGPLDPLARELGIIL